MHPGRWFVYGAAVAAGVLATATTYGLAVLVLTHADRLMPNAAKVFPDAEFLVRQRVDPRGNELPDPPIGKDEHQPLHGAADARGDIL